MDKFGLFNAFTKLANNKTVEKTLTNALSSILQNAVSQNNNTKEITKKQPTVMNAQKNKTLNKYSQEYIISVMKKHDELSKKIDENLKNNQ